jgi:hypothetical protein
MPSSSRRTRPPTASSGRTWPPSRSRPRSARRSCRLLGFSRRGAGVRVDLCANKRCWRASPWCGTTSSWTGCASQPTWTNACRSSTATRSGSGKCGSTCSATPATPCPRAGPSRCAPGWTPWPRASPCGWRTPARAYPPGSSPASSTPSSPPSRSAKAPAWDWRCRSASSRTTAGPFGPRVRTRAGSPRASCPRTSVPDRAPVFRVELPVDNAPENRQYSEDREE